MIITFAQGKLGILSPGLPDLDNLFPTMLGSDLSDASDLRSDLITYRCFIWSDWLAALHNPVTHAIFYPFVRLVIKHSGFWLPVTTISPTMPRVAKPYVNQFWLSNKLFNSHISNAYWLDNVMNPETTPLSFRDYG